jgi:HEAT repeat protein
MIEVAWKIEDVRRSLQFISEHGARGDRKTVAAIARIFSQTQDKETQRLCLNSLYHINNEAAKKELLHIYQTPELDSRLRSLSAELLRAAIREDKRIPPSEVKAIVSVIGQ